MTPAVARDRRRGYIAWCVVCVLWGTTYLGIRVALDTVPPALLTGLRFSTAGALLLAILAMRGVRLPSRDSWPGLALVGGLMVGAGNGGVVWGEQYVPSGLAAVVIASTPFWMMGVEAMVPGGERITRRGVIGLIIGMVGIVLLVWTDLMAGGAHGVAFLLGILSLQAACLGWAAGSSWSKRHALHDNPLAAAAGQMLAGGLLMLLVGTVAGEWSALHFTVRSAAAMIYLLVFGSLVGFAAYVYALKQLPVSFVSLYAYINPVIAVALGVALLGEPFNLRILIGSAIVFAGLAVIRWKSGAQAVTRWRSALDWIRARRWFSEVGDPADRSTADGRVQ